LQSGSGWEGLYSSPQTGSRSCRCPPTNSGWLEVLEAQRAEICPGPGFGLWESCCGCAPPQEAVVFSSAYRKGEWMSWRDQEQTAISLLWDRGLGAAIFALTLGRDVESWQRTKAQKTSFH